MFFSRRHIVYMPISMTGRLFSGFSSQYELLDWHRLSIVIPNLQ